MFVAAVFRMANKWRQPTCPLKDKLIKKMKYSQPMEYTTLSMKEIMLHAIAWTNLKDSRLSKINQSQKVYV